MKTLIVGLIFILACIVPSIGSDSTKVSIKIETSSGNIELELDTVAAPKTVGNFLSYAIPVNPVFIKKVSVLK